MTNLFVLEYSTSLQSEITLHDTRFESIDGVYLAGSLVPSPIGIRIVSFSLIMVCWSQVRTTSSYDSTKSMMRSFSLINA